MKQLEQKQLLQIGDAVLSPENIQCIEQLQSENNLHVNTLCEDLADAVCYLTEMQDDAAPEVIEKLRQHSINISHARHALKNLKRG